MIIHFYMYSLKDRWQISFNSLKTMVENYTKSIHFHFFMTKKRLIDVVARQLFLEGLTQSSHD